MPANHAAKKGIKYLDFKILVAALSIGGTVGLWNLFSIDAVNAAKPEAAGLQAPPPESTGLPPLPTLVPLVDVSTLQAAPVMAESVPGVVPQSPGTLRSVGAPPVTIVQKGKPQVNEAVVTAGGGGGKRTATRTRSSR